MLRLFFQPENISESTQVIDFTKRGRGIYVFFYDYYGNRELCRIDIMDYKKRDPEELCEFLQKNYEVEL